MGRGICINCARAIDWIHHCPIGYCNSCCADLCHRRKKLPKGYDPAREVLNALGYGATKEQVKDFLRRKKNDRPTR